MSTSFLSILIYMKCVIYLLYSLNTLKTNVCTGRCLRFVKHPSITARVLWNPCTLPVLLLFLLGARMAHWVRSLETSLSPIRRGFKPGFVNYKKGCTLLAAACDKIYQFLAHGRWFSPGTLASSTTKTGRHDIAEILLKVALKHTQTIYFFYFYPTVTIVIWLTILSL